MRGVRKKTWVIKGMLVRINDHASPKTALSACGLCGLLCVWM
jgi:hypothetical protein